MPEGNAAYAFHENCAHWVSERALLSIEGPWFQNTTSTGYDFDVAKLMLRPLPVPPDPLEPRPPKTPDRRGDGGDSRLHPGAGGGLDGAQGALRARPGLADRGPGAVGVADPEVGLRNQGVRGVHRHRRHGRRGDARAGGRRTRRSRRSHAASPRRSTRRFRGWRRRSRRSTMPPATSTRFSPTTEPRIGWGGRRSAATVTRRAGFQPRTTGGTAG